MRLENLAFCRWSVLKRAGWHTEVLAKCQVSWWENNHLRHAKAAKIASELQNRVSVIYVAPVDTQDASRMRHLIELLQKPFVLHLWDLLDAPLEQSADLQWLVRHAGHVCCVSAPLLADVSRYRSDGSYLLFSRKPSHVVAHAPNAKTLEVALIGDVASYSDGVTILRDAMTLLKRNNISVRVSYVGPVRILKRLPSPLREDIRPFGFVTSEEARDEFLSACHAGFLPGPFKSPEHDMRSRFSIPSRLLDFLANGLPVVGAVHPESATAQMVKSISKSDSLFCRTAKDTATTLEQLMSVPRWQHQSRDSLRMFSRLTQDSEPEKLRQIMESLADSGQGCHAG